MSCSSSYKEIFVRSNIISSFRFSFESIRAHFFRTALSVLGIVIGVAALVAILALIDGMEQYAKDQITQTTSLKAIQIRSQPMKSVNGVSIRKDSFNYLSYHDFIQLRNSLPYPAITRWYTSMAKEVTFEEVKNTTAAIIRPTYNLVGAPKLIAGDSFDSLQVEARDSVAVINDRVAKAVLKEDDISKLIGTWISIGNLKLRVLGITETHSSDAGGIYIPITLLDQEALKEYPPSCVLELANVEHVADAKKFILSWIQKQYPGSTDFEVFSHEARVEQAAKGFRLFRIIMGLIVGISVLVGGIGVMNVLLISVTERTVEIGIRKAVGANRKHIVLQFLAESVTISTFGSFLGLIIGVLATMTFVPLIKSLTGIPFLVAYTWNTFILITIISIAVGVIFGTYPALRASRLNPVEAIRKE
jgi:putative ABC transport system permease protein